MKKILVLVLAVCLMMPVSFAGGWFTGASSWAEEALYEAMENGIISESDFVDKVGGYSNNITRLEFAGLMMNLYKQMMGNLPVAASTETFTDTTDKNVLMAFNVGIISGKGQGVFAPNDSITRQEMAIMMMNALNSMNIDYKKGDGILTVTDKASVSNWAANGVDFVYESGLMEGDGINFNPLKNTPIEQAVVVVNKVYKKYKDSVPKEEVVKEEVTVVPSDYTKGYALNLNNGSLAITFNNNDETIMVEAEGVLKADYSPMSLGKYYYLKNSRVYRQNLDTKTGLTSISDKTSLWGNVTDFQVVKGGLYDGYVVMKYTNNKTYSVYTNENKVTYVGEIESLDDINYQIGGLYESIEFAKYQFSITVTDPSQNMDHVKFTEDDMYFYSGGSHYDEIVNNVGYLRLYPTNYEDDAYVGPLGRAGDASGQWVFNGYGGIYETDIKFNNNSGNAGIVFNLKYAGDGNDNYAGYYAGIDVVNNKVMIGKSAYGKWTKIKESNITGNIDVNQTVRLKVVKNHSKIQAYVDNKLYLEINDDTYMNDGGFGVRTWKSDATYSNYTINPLPF